jgi:hypothetical protein
VTHATAAPPRTEAATSAGATAARRPRPKSAANLLMIAAAIAGIVAVGYFVVQALGEGNGAGSPEAAVTRVTDAVNRQDAVGVLDAVNPEEVHDLASVYEEIVERLDRTGLRGSHPDIEGAVSGIENVRFENPEFQVDKLAGDVAKVTWTGGTLRYDVVPTSLDLSSPVYDGSVSSTAEEREKRTEQRTPADVAYTVSDADGREHTVRPFLMTVRRGGGWYVSLTYSAAQHAIEALGVPSPDWSAKADDAPGEAVAASTPDDVIRGLARAVSNKDVTGGAGYLAAKEMRVVRLYAAPIQSLISRQLDPSQRLGIEIANLRTSTERASGGLVKVNIETASGSLTSSSDDDYDSVSFDFDGLCLHTSSEDSTDRTCIEDRLKRITGISKPFVLMKREGGRYTLSPLATVLEYARILNANVPDQFVQRVVNSYGSAPISATLAPGALVEGELNEAGFAVYGFEGRKGDLIAVAGSVVDPDEEALEVAIFGPDNVRIPIYPRSVLPADGTYRVVLTWDALEPARFKARLDRLDPKRVSLPARQSVTLAPYETAALSFEVATASSYTVSAEPHDDESYVEYEVVGPDGTIYCSSSCEFPPGRYTVYLHGPDEGATVDVRIAELTVGFAGGSKTVRGSLASSSDVQTFTLYTVADETVTIELTCAPTLDCQLSVEDGDLRADSGLAGGSETLTFTALGTSTTVLVSAWSGEGSFELRVV